MTADELRTTRLSLGLTVTAWAEALGVSRQHASDIDSGRRQPSPTLLKLAEMYRRHGLPPAD